MHSWDGDGRSVLARCASSLEGVAGGLARLLPGVARALLDATCGVGHSLGRLPVDVVDLRLGVTGRSASGSGSACTRARSQPPPAALLSDVHAERMHLTMNTSAAGRRTTTSRERPGHMHTQ